MLRLRRLWLRAFRNYDRAELLLGGGTTAFIGPNAAGKSNLLEAIYLVATGRSHRTVHEAEAIRFGETSARVRALVTRRGRDEELEITLAADQGKQTSQMRVNGAVTPRGSVLGRLPVVLAAPWDLDVVRGPAAGRRRLLNGALAQLSPSYHFALHRYHRVVAQRNAGLRRRSPGGLEPWDAQMVDLGVRLTAHRREYVWRLAPQASAWFGQLGGLGALGAAYRAAWEGPGDEEVADVARAQMARCRADEFRRGVTLTGPHRDDVELTLDGVPLRACGSLGQWRTAMLALRLAERAVMGDDLGASPLLLLDDVLAELDHERQGRLLDLDDEAQVLLSATTLPGGGSPGRPRCVFSVAGGTIREDEWSPRSESERS